jgi:hypothetical protein
VVAHPFLQRIEAFAGDAAGADSAQLFGVGEAALELERWRPLQKRKSFST